MAYGIDNECQAGFRVSFFGYGGNLRLRASAGRALVVLFLSLGSLIRLLCFASKIKLRDVHLF